jgi:hypothetical protein
MADSHAWARSNYFAVKDADAFRAATAPFDVEVITDTPTDGAGTLYALLCDTDNGWPTTLCDEATGEDREVDFATVVAEHLAHDHVAILMESGHQKLQYVGGHAVAIDGGGERREVSLDDIYRCATELGNVASRAEW